MLEQGYEIDITKDAVEVKQDSSMNPMSSRLVPCVLSVGVAIFLFAITIFGPGKHDRPSVWQDLKYYAWPSSDFTAALVMVIAMGTLSLLLILFGLRQLFPSGTELHADHATLTVSEIPSYSLHGKWKSWSYPLSSISDFKFAVTRTGRGSVFYGFRFIADGDKRKMFTGMEAPEADKILNGLKALGVEVIDDPDMQTKIKETLTTRMGTRSNT